MVVVALKKTAIGTSHAKVILLGEHAVVYGQPAIALPLPDITFTAVMEERASGQMILGQAYQGPLSNLAENYEGIRQLITKLLRHFDAQDLAFTLRITSSIPQERGMGSSAASAIAITRAFYAFFGAEITDQRLQHWASIEEGITHGSPSGIDAATVASLLPVWFVKNDAPTPIEFNLDGVLIMADTGIHGQTGLAVSVVRSNLADTPKETQAHIDALGDLTTQAKDILAAGQAEALGGLMNTAQDHLNGLGISHPKLETLITAARQAGALGAKLTGGGVGGAMIALAKDQSSAQKIILALEKAGAHEVWSQSYQKK